MKHKNIKEAMRAAKKSGQPQVLAAQNIEDIKINIGIRLDSEVLNRLKIEAEKKGLPYQTHINSILKQHMDSPSLLERIEAIEKVMKKSS